MNRPARLTFGVFRPQELGIRKVLGELEATTMEFVWRHTRPGESISVREVFEGLKAERKIAYTTVMSTMARLAAKGLLDVESREQTYRYRPSLTEGQLAEHIVANVLGSLMMNFKGETLAYLGNLRGSSPETFEGPPAELRKEVRGRREPKHGGPKS